MSYKNLKKMLKNSKIEKASNIIISLNCCDETFFRNLLKAEILPEPISLNYEANSIILMNFIKSCELVEKKIKDNVSFFSNRWRMLIKSIKLLKNEINYITTELEKCKFSQLDTNRQIHILLSHIQDLDVRVDLNWQSKTNRNHQMTGFEYETANQEIFISAKNTSIGDIFESNIECTEIVLDYINYLKRKNNSTPYIAQSFSFYQLIEEVNFNNVMILAHCRLYINELWENIKYSGWIFDENIKDNKVEYFFRPNTDIGYDMYFYQRVAIKRYAEEMYKQLTLSSNKNFNLLQSQYDLLDNLSSKWTNIYSIFNSNLEIFIELSQTEYAFILEQEKKMSVTLCNDLYKQLVGKEKNIPYIYFQKAYLFLSAIGKMYRHFLMKSIDEHKVITTNILVPHIPKKILYENLSRLTNMSVNDAKKVIDCFIYKFNKSKIDIFSEPLIENESNVFFSPVLINQLIYNRAVELQIYKAHDSSIPGFQFENTIKKAIVLNKPDMLQIAKNKVEYIAFDGDQIEFDCIFLFEDKLFIIEAKKLKQPFGSKELSNVETEINKALKQLARRKQSIIKDWKKFKDNCDIKLPIDSPNSDNIIKVICLNTYNYTGNIIDDCFITDIKVLCRFWYEPEIMQTAFQNGKVYKEKVVEKLWESYKPSPNDFIKYLKDPLHIKYIKESMKEYYRKYYINSNDCDIYKFEYILEKDPNPKID
ncbi:hypothetical protein [Wukongibacter sp. M2B1]|uniref:hypothetical protein n=1 Tax=Wukongibacter sp. M2B1 TaxID=3088895 RepID=UPI003D7A6548